MTNSITNTTFNANEELKRLADKLDDASGRLAEYDCYICDAISEIADGDVSVYTADLVEYALENDDDVEEALTEGLALGGAEYFERNRGRTFRDYAAHVGAMAWYLATERRIYDELEDAVTHAVLNHLAETYGVELDRGAWDHVRECHAIEWDDNGADLSGIYDDAERLYSDALEGADEDEE